MTNEEFLKLLDELNDNLYDLSFNDIKERVGKLRDYAKDNYKAETLVNDAVSKLDDVVYGDIQANPNEPKGIVLSNQKSIDLDNLIYKSDEDNYYDKLKEKVLSEKEANENENVDDSKNEVLEEDRSKYIPGTNKLKPRNRGIFESDEDYVKYLEEYYSKIFPDYNASKQDKKDVIDEKAPKSLALLSDVKEPEKITNLKEPEKITNLKDIINDDKKFESEFAGVEALDTDDDYEDIYSDSSKKAKSIFDDEEKEEINFDSDEEKEEINFDSDEELENFKKDLDIDYEKDKDKETKKVSKIRKATKKFKDVLKKHGKKIIAGILVAVAAIGAISSIKGCSYDKKDDLKENKDNPKSNTDEYKDSIPSVVAADSFGSFDKSLDNENTNDIDDDKVETSSYSDSDLTVEDYSSQDYTNDSVTNDYSTNDSATNDSETNDDVKYDADKFDIGETIHFDGDKLHVSAFDAANETNGLTPYFSNDDNREVSLINFISPDGSETRTASTNEEAQSLRKDGWKELAYNIRNNDHNTDYEGWTNDISKVK